MDIWLKVLIEIGILAFFLLIYYVFQKRRIIRFDQAEIMDMVHHISIELNEYLHDKDTSPNYKELNDFTQRLEQNLESQKPEEIIKTLENLPSSLPPNIMELVTEVKKRLQFYQKN